MANKRHLTLATEDGKTVDPNPPQPREGSPEWFAMMRDAGYGGWGMMTPHYVPSICHTVALIRIK